MLITHLCGREAWQAALPTGEYRSDSLAAEGFIHASTPEQVAASANRYYRGRQDMLLLVIDTDRVACEIKWEMTKNGQTYPHLYGPLNLDAVTAAHAYLPQPDGTFAPPPMLPPA